MGPVTRVVNYIVYGIILAAFVLGLSVEMLGFFLTALGLGPR